MRSNNKRAQILEAALRVVDARGSNHLTIDAVAAEAGLSKGGVLYHFASKQALLQGMLDGLISAHQERTEKQPASRSRFAASLHLDDPMTPKEQRASLAILAAVAEDPELIASASVYMKDTVATAISDVPADRQDEALVLWLATEGLRFLNILSINPMSPRQTKSVIAHMSNRAEVL